MLRIRAPRIHLYSRGLWGVELWNIGATTGTVRETGMSYDWPHKSRPGHWVIGGHPILAPNQHDGAPYAGKLTLSILFDREFK